MPTTRLGRDDFRRWLEDLEADSDSELWRSSA
jgi:hypothetical protein